QLGEISARFHGRAGARPSRGGFAAAAAEGPVRILTPLVAGRAGARTAAQMTFNPWKEAAPECAEKSDGNDVRHHPPLGGRYARCARAGPASRPDAARSGHRLTRNARSAVRDRGPLRHSDLGRGSRRLELASRLRGCRGTIDRTRSVPLRSPWRSLRSAP